MSRTLDMASLQAISFFEKMTGAAVKDFVSDQGLFIIAQGEMGKAIGKGASNVRKLEHLLKKPVKLIEFNDDVTLFTRNLCYPADVTDIKEVDGVVTIHGKDTRSKGLIIGRDRSRLKQITTVVQRHFSNVKEIKVA